MELDFVNFVNFELDGYNATICLVDSLAVEFWKNEVMSDCDVRLIHAALEEKFKLFGGASSTKHILFNELPEQCPSLLDPARSAHLVSFLTLLDVRCKMLTYSFSS